MIAPSKRRGTTSPGTSPSNPGAGGSQRQRILLHSGTCRRGKGRLDGLIPTHAGKTMLARVQPAGSWAHPRTYGEHVFCLFAEDAGLGSSPRIRGTPSGWSGSFGARGLIPAHTGNTGLVFWGCCGRGSSPRIRGTHSATSRNTQAKSKNYSLSTRM